MLPGCSASSRRSTASRIARRAARRRGIRDVRFFDDPRRATATLVGQFYLDLYARDGKRGGAWMDDAINAPAHRRRRCRRRSRISSATSRAPVGGKPALFTHDEVITLFHEFGHGLHHLLTRVDDLGVSGHQRRRVGRGRAAEPVHGELLLGMGRAAPHDAHVDTGAPLPRALFDKMLAAKNFQSGLQTVRQLEFALFDMRLHYDYDPPARRRALAAARRGARRGRRRARRPPYNRFPHSFSHIFAGGYAAGYYSYKWAEVLSADAFSLFEEHGVLDAGDRRSASATRSSPSAAAAPRARVVRRLPRPRAQLEALLRHNGMTALVRIATWNVNSLRVRLPHVLDWLRRAQPDVLACRRPRRRTRTSRAELRARATRSCSAARRPTTASRSSPRSRSSDVAHGIPDFGRAEARARRDLRRRAGLQPVRAERRGTRVRQVSPTSCAGSRRCALVCSRRAAKHPQLAVLGDFNVAPEDRDVHDPKRWEGKIHVSEPERAALRK